MSADRIPTVKIAAVLRDALRARRISIEELALEAEAAGAGPAWSVSRWLRKVLEGEVDTVTVDAADRYLTAIELPLPDDDQARPAGGEAWCPTCRTTVATTPAGECVWCDTPTGGQRQPPRQKKRAHAGVPFMMSEEVILEARRLYESGLSLRQVAGRIHDRTSYSSVKSFANALHATFTHRGWALRDRLTAVRAATYRHGMCAKGADRAAYRRMLRRRHGHQCEATLTRGNRRCANTAIKGERWCTVHHPDRAPTVIENLAEARRRYMQQANRPCRAVVENGPRTGQPCRGTAMPGIDYCVAHRHHAHPGHGEQHVGRLGRDPELLAPYYTERFWSRVAVADPAECWIWTSHHDGNGYGHMSMGGRAGRNVKAHRISYVLAHGPIPEGLEIDHLCRTKLCVNPLHLEAVTHQENMRRCHGAGVNHAKTQCIHGHPFDAENTMWRAGGGRKCRECHRETCRRYRRRLNGAFNGR